MSRAVLASLLALVALIATSRHARADEPRHLQGVAVVATDGATDVAWPLASAIYGNVFLKPVHVDDERARVLAGEPAPIPSSELTDLAELRAGVKGDDAASRQVLSAIADKVAVRAIVVVFAGDPPSARVYDVESHAFDAARYGPDATSTSRAPKWEGAARSLGRSYIPAAALASTQIAVSPVAPVAPIIPPATPKKSESKAFYESPWFWVAIGAAALIGGGILIATNVQTSDTIHLQVRMP